MILGYFALIVYKLYCRLILPSSFWRTPNRGCLGSRFRTSFVGSFGFSFSVLPRSRFLPWCLIVTGCVHLASFPTSPVLLFAFLTFFRRCALVVSFLRHSLCSRRFLLVVRFFVWVFILAWLLSRVHLLSNAGGRSGSFLGGWGFFLGFFWVCIPIVLERLLRRGRRPGLCGRLHRIDFRGKDWWLRSLSRWKILAIGMTF